MPRRPAELEIPPPPPGPEGVEPAAGLGKGRVAMTHPVAPPSVEPDEPALTADAELHRALLDAHAHAEKIRVSRKPFGSMRQKLAWPPRSGYHRHWFNDDPGRIQEARAAGYESVKDHDGQIVSRPVGTAKAGGVLLGYLMEIPEVLWLEDMRAAQELANEREQAILKSEPRGKALKQDDRSKFYQPDSMPTRIETSTRFDQR